MIAVALDLPDNVVDYVFTDPPFGENIYYADLNYLLESWHRVRTATTSEAIIDRAKGKTLTDYLHAMQRCFAEYRRVLKPGRWMTVVFHNSRNAVWNAIQEAILAAGFVVADVPTLDKRQGSYRQVTSTAVKQDLVISAYKPNYGLEARFELAAGNEEGVWDFVRTHLRHLPVFVASDDRAEVIAERQNFLLFDRMVAFHVQRGVLVPFAAAEFHAGLETRFPQRDGMFFLPEQVAEYDSRRLKAKALDQLTLFVDDEASAIQWLRQTLTGKPQTFQDVHPHFIRELRGWQKHERMPELSALLAQNFLRYDGVGDVPGQIHGYLSTNFKELRNLDKDDPALRAKATDRWYVPDPRKGRRPGEAARTRLAAGIRRLPRLRPAPTARVPPGSSARRLPRRLAAAGLRHHHRRRAEDPGCGAPGRPQTTHVARPGPHPERPEPWTDMNSETLSKCARAQLNPIPNGAASLRHVSWLGTKEVHRQVCWETSRLPSTRPGTVSMPLLSYFGTRSVAVPGAAAQERIKA